MNDHNFESGLSKNEKSLLPDQEFELMLKKAYNLGNEEEKRKTLQLLEEEPQNKEVYDGILIVKEKEGFTTIDEHLNYIKKDKKKLTNFYEDWKTKNAVQKTIKE
ncbi:MAG: hypothetical protein R2764_08290 [Bacteroidales bacterium]